MMKRIFGLFAPALVAGFLLAGFGGGAWAQSCSGTPNANTVCAGPTSGGSGFPNFRTVVPADVPFTQVGTGAVQRTLDAHVKDTPITPYDYGAKGDGATDDTAALVAWAASSGNNNQATYCPPGTYLTTQTVVFMPFSPGSGITPNSWVFDKRCIIRANAAMTTLVQFGSSAANFSGIIRNGIIDGGLFDANLNAQVALWVPFYNDIIVTSRTMAENALYRNYRLGDANAPQHSYGVTFSGDTFRSVLNRQLSITSITNANPAVVTTSTNHNLLSNQLVQIENAGGMTQVNNKYFAITFVSNTSFQLQNTDSTGFGTYTSGGLATGNVFGLTLPNLITGITQANPAVVTTSAPHGLLNGQQVLVYGVVGMYQVDGIYTVAGATSTTFQLSGINSTGFNAYSSGGIARLNVPQVGISAITNANPAAVTTSANHGLSTGNQVFIEGIVGMGGNIYGLYNVTVSDATHFSLNGVNSTSFGSYTSGGLVRQSVYEPLYGVCLENSSDNYSEGGVLNGNAIGIGGCAGNLVFDGSFKGTHVWNNVEAGEVQSCYQVDGDNKLTNLQCDGPFAFAYRFRNLRNRLINSNTNYQAGYNLVGVPVRIESGGGVYSTGNSFKGGGSTINLFEASAALSDRANYVTGNNAQAFTQNLISQAPLRQWNGGTPASVTMAGATVYLGPAGADTTGGLGNSGWVVGGACTIASADLLFNAAPGASQSYTATLMQNGTATSITGSASGTATFSIHLAGPWPLNALDTLGIKLVGSASAAAAQFRYVVQGNC